ncbi:uncharacterized protein LOC142588001 [Dermacentor variabilis]|uniref:uncharacterized protein LOC142588001 n=1 Tax=Dermacentor variabilis TaxID=34621 RepID=UPI003F5C7B0A
MDTVLNENSSLKARYPLNVTVGPPTISRCLSFGHGAFVWTAMLVVAAVLKAVVMRDLKKFVKSRSARQLRKLKQSKYYLVGDIALCALPVVDSERYAIFHGGLLFIYVLCSSSVITTKATALKTVCSQVTVGPPTISRCLSFGHGAFVWTAMLVVAAVLKAVVMRDLKKFVKSRSARQLRELERSKYYLVGDIALCALPVVDSERYAIFHGGLLFIYVLCSSSVITTKATALKTVCSQVTVGPPTISRCLSFGHGAFVWTAMLVVAAVLKAVVMRDLKKFVKSRSARQLRQLKQSKYYLVGDIALCALPVVDSERYAIFHGGLLFIYVLCSSSVITTKATALKTVCSQVTVGPPTISRCLSFGHGAFLWTAMLVVAALLKAVVTRDLKKFVKSRSARKLSQLRELERSKYYLVGDIALCALPVVDSERYAIFHGGLLFIYVLCSSSVITTKATALKTVCGQVTIGPPTISRCLSFGHGAYVWTAMLVVAALLKAVVTRDLKKFVKSRSARKLCQLHELERSKYYLVGDLALCALPLVDAENYAVCHGGLLCVYVLCSSGLIATKATALKTVCVQGAARAASTFVRLATLPAAIFLISTGSFKEYVSRFALSWENYKFWMVAGDSRASYHIKVFVVRTWSLCLDRDACRGCSFEGCGDERSKKICEE